MLLRPGYTLAVALLAALLCGGCRPSRPVAPPPAATDGEPFPPPFDAVGPRRAKVQVQQLLDFETECQWENVRTLREVANAAKGKVRVTFCNSRKPDGKDLMKKLGITCQAQLVINGQKDFTVNREGKDETVQVHGPFNLTTADNVSDVLIQAIRAAGDLPADQEAKIRQAVTDGFARMDKEKAKNEGPSKADGEAKDQGKGKAEAKDK